MNLIVGLGNPGEKYVLTRHNVGFLAVDEFAKENRFSGFLFEKKSNSLVSEGELENMKVVLAKPQTFMNNSGIAVQKLCKNYYIAAKDIIVLHDDIDLPLGKIKISTGSGSAGHKGAESIIQTLGSQDFTRIRIGIQPPKGKPEGVESFVVRKFFGEEKEIISQTLQDASHALCLILLQGLERAMNEINT